MHRRRAWTTSSPSRCGWRPWRRSLERWVANSEIVPERGGAHALPDIRDPLDRSQIELLLSLDDGAGGGAGRDRHRVPDRRRTGCGSSSSESSVQGDSEGPRARRPHALRVPARTWVRPVLADLCAGWRRHAREAQLDDAVGLVEQFETEFARVPAALQVVPSEGVTMRVLIADDDPTSRLLAQSHRLEAGSRVPGGRGGLDRVGTPVVRGHRRAADRLDDARARRTRAVPAGPRTKPSDSYIYIVSTTGLDHPEHVLEGMSAGADDYLDQAGRLVRRADPAGGGRAGHRAARQAGADPGRAREGQSRAPGAVAHRRADGTGQSPAHGGGRCPDPCPRPAGSVGRTAMALFDIDHFKLYNDSLRACGR